MPKVRKIVNNGVKAPTPPQVPIAADVKKLPPKKKPALKKKPIVEPVVEVVECVDAEVESVESVESEPAVEEVKEAPAPAKTPKVKRPPSLWMLTLKEAGYMIKGAEFKPTPKKGTPEYIAVRRLFDEKKNQPNN